MSEFEIFWQLYPRHTAKIAAEKAYEKAAKKTDHHIIRAAAVRYADACKGKEEQYICLPATWLNQGRWMDQKQSSVTQKTFLHPPARAFPEERLYPPRPRPDTWANVFVPNTAPQYAALLERAAQRDTDPREFLYDNNGIWVARTWIHE